MTTKKIVAAKRTETKKPAKSLDETRLELVEIEQRLFDVDAQLAMFVKACHDDDVKIETEAGELIAVARPVALAQRELEALRAKVAGVIRDVEGALG